MHRCFVNDRLLAGGRYALDADEAAHVLRVLRMRAGDAVELIDGESLFSGEIEAASQGGVFVRALDKLPSPECKTRITLYQGLPKQNKLEMIVQKATELGVYGIAPVETARSVVKAGGREKGDRYARIALEAAKQAGRARVPIVDAPKRLGDVIGDVRGHALALVAWEDAHEMRISDAIADYRARAGGNPPDIAIVIGPEGGIEKGEIDVLVSAGAIPVTLGRRILRTETAGLCAVTLALGALGDM